MPEQEVKRRLTTILAADVVGYSRLMAVDEPRTLADYKATQADIIYPEAADHSGRVVNIIGDSILMEFGSVVDAVNCSVAIQLAVSERNSGVLKDRQFLLRIGVNIGDVIVDGDTIFGNGVNVASRLESLADPGGICISSTVVDHVKGKVPFGFEGMGSRSVKNIPAPLEVYRLVLGAAFDDVERRAFQASIGLDLSLPKDPSIAVLPFTVMGDDPDQEYFVDGVVEDIITALSKVSRLMVVARNSSFVYKGKPVDVKQVSHEQGVRYVLEGSVRKAGSRVRVTAQLIDATTGMHMWAERYDRDLDDIFAVQDEITREIVIALDVQMREGEQHRMWSSGTRNLEAW